MSESPRRVYQSPEHPYSESRMTKSGLLFVSGVLPYRDDGTIESDPFRAIACAVRQLAVRLADAGCGLENVVDVMVFVTDIETRSMVNEVFSQVFSNPMPCRSVIGVKALPQRAVVEIRAVAEA
jgi:2-iminobutanoate/2-iminopropanoate deaminase